MEYSLRCLGRSKTEAKSEMAPQIIANRYRIIELIGTGGMASVWRGFDQTLGRLVAVKTMKPELAVSSKFAEQFLKEARSAAQLNDPHIVSVFDWGVDRGNCYIVMELVDGFDLRSMLRNQGDFYPEAAARIVRQVCQALEVAHSHGIVHSDVKPSNILFSRTGVAKIADFGIVQTSRGKHARGTAGTARYMSPEQAAGKALDRRSDVYSLGVTLYEMCGGIRRAHAAESAASEPGSIGCSTGAPWSYVPLSQVSPYADEEFDHIIETCLQDEPARRFPTTSKLRDALEGYLNAHSTTDPDTLGPQSPDHWALAFVASDGRNANSVIIERPVTIGRNAETDVQIPSRSVSGIHAYVEPKGAFLIVEDLGSSNGTFVNGLPIAQRSYCRPGDVLKIGATRLRIGCKH